MTGFTHIINIDVDKLQFTLPDSRDYDILLEVSAKQAYEILREHAVNGIIEGDKE